ncbi:MAG: ATP-binding protein [Planctomycetota bacterium]
MTAEHTLTLVGDRPTGPLNPGDLGELLLAFNDVTGKLQTAHEQLRAEVARLTRELSDANEQLERARRLAALGEMAAGIAHEVRNPLGSIRLYARMLTQDLADRPGERAISEKIARAASHLDTVVGDVLTFSRELRVRRQATTAGTVFDGVLEACCHDGVAGWNTIRITRTGDSVELNADALLVQQALVNIVRNAIEAMVETSDPAQPHELALGARKSRVRGQEEVVLSVRDTGPGVAPEIVQRMFNPFFTTRTTGTGLGLAIVHRIVDAHAGRVSVANNAERTPGARGAVFGLHIPMKETGTGDSTPFVRSHQSPVHTGTPNNTLSIAEVA